MAVDWYGDQILARMRQGALRGVVAGTEMVLEEGNRMIREPPKTGVVYRRRGRSHQASAPGEAPATDTGRLIQSSRAVYDQPDLLGIATWSTSYAARLEYGFVGEDSMGRNYDMEPRPYARPALATMRDQILERIMREIRGSLS